MLTLEMKILSDAAHISGVRKAVEQLCAREGFDETTTGMIGLCLNEALANVIRHAYGCAKDKPIVVRADYHDGMIEITIRDWGSGVNPDCLPHKAHDPMTPGGLGLMCLREMMTEVKYEPQGDGILMRMTKKRPLLGQTMEPK